MKNHPRIQSIFIAPTAGVPMQALPNAEILATGIKGDRYASGVGAHSNNSPKKIRHISLITQSGIATANEWLSTGGEDPFNEAQTRRNIVLSNMSAGDLNLLVGQTFKLGEVILRGTELCTPCTRPSELLNKSGFLDAFDGRGGLRAEIMKVGTISIGDILVCEPKES